MADDVKTAMDLLHIGKADMIGISQGGMIAQHFAADYPEAVGWLVLAVTAARLHESGKQIISYWMQLAGRDAYRN